MPNLLVRILSALAILPPVLAIILFAPPVYFGITAMIVAALAAFEFGTITFGVDYPRHRWLLGLFSAAMCGAISFSRFFPEAPLIAATAAVPLLMLSFMFSRTDPSLSMKATAFAVTGTFYAGALFGAMGLLVNVRDDGNMWFLLLLCATVLSDTFAYTFGRLFGKRKLAPALSPGKTWAGSIGGVVGSVMSVAAMKFLFIDTLTWWDIPVLGISLSVFCQVGDLAESFLKRSFHVKDSGSLIPGHGGILDRCDALMFGAPVVLLYALLR